MQIKKIIPAIEWRFGLIISIVKWWINGKKGMAPHLFKQLTIKKYQRKTKARIFVETGTFRGDMINALKNHFNEMHSIELNPEFYKNACERFKNNKHIKIWNGDSALILKDVIKNINENIIFWLDGHCCIDNGKITSMGIKNTPIVLEIEEIAKHQQKNELTHTLLIDDARLFNGTDDYPEINEFISIVKNLFHGYSIHIENDIIICIKK
jgi:hypothetical protein